MSRIHVSISFPNTPAYNKEYWWTKTSQEQLAASLKMIRHAYAIDYATPKNSLLKYRGRVINV